MAMLNGSWMGMQVGGTIDGKQMTFTTGELLDTVTNGMIFHEDPAHRKAVEMFASVPRWNYLWPTIHFKIMPIKRAAVMLFHYLNRDSILNDADYPEQWQAAKRAWEASNRSAGTA
jgi:hypothetical protein